MSRIIVKGLKDNVDYSILNRIFSQYGTITDIKIVKNKLGKIRGFCFIGYSTQKSAKQAIKDMNGLFIQDKKVIIEEALPNFSKKKFKENRLTLYDINFKKNFPNNCQNIVKLTENIGETGILYIRNISQTCKDYDLEILFRNFGYIEYINIVTKKENKDFAVCAYIKFGLPECAVNAAANLDGKIFQGRIMHIICSLKYSPNFLRIKKNFAFNSFKNIKKNLDFEQFIYNKSWFLLFIPGDIIIKNLISKLGCSENLIFNYKHLKINSGKNTITEGRIQNEAFLILKKEGLNLNSFNPVSLKYKSQKTLLIKNLPIQKKKTLYLLLKKFGNIMKYALLPLTGLIIIEFKKKNEALLAHRYLEKLMKDENILSVQWAPLNCFKPLGVNNYDDQYIFHTKKIPLSNLNKEKNTNNIYYTTGNYFNKNKKTKNTCKVLIRNIPFYTKLTDLKKIFNGYNKIISIRLPKKKNGENRGFCFVDFCTLDDAKKTIILLQNIHLGKRHLLFSIVE